MPATIEIISDGREWISPTDGHRHPTAVRAVMAELRPVLAARGEVLPDELLEARAVATLRRVAGFRNEL